MKIKYIFFGMICSIMAMSCTDYLDVSPDSGLTDEEIFTSYGNTLNFFNSVYTGSRTELNPKVYNMSIKTAYPINSQSAPRYFSFYATTDICDNGRGTSSTAFKRGNCANNGVFTTFYNDASSNNFRPVFKAMWNVIRICNRVLMNLDRVEDANSQKDIEDIRGQAYFLRAYAHFVVGTIWGPFPYVTDIMTPENYDRPRLSAPDYFKAIADDCDNARRTFEAVGLMRRDPGPGQAGHLNDVNQNKPAGMAALALKSRALLYRASPLSNPGQDPQLWIEAAEAAAEAIKVAKQYQYELLPWEKYYDSFYGPKYSNEQFWSDISPNTLLTRMGTRVILGSTMTGQKECNGEFPTQNVVDMYDTKWGDVLVTEADRQAAALKGHYDEQDPYANRDPRLAGNIYYNQHDITWSSQNMNQGEEANKFNCYYTMKDGKQVFSTFAQGYGGLLGDTQTGYVGRKRFGDWHAGKKSPVPSQSDVLFRMVELYLNYAEATNEAFGPDGKSPSGDMTALEALNVVRERVSPELKLKSDDPTVDTPDAFRKRVQKERTVEFDQESNHRYYDIRRWKIAPEVMSAPLYGIMIEQISDDTSLPYNQRFRHTRYLLQDTHQPIWNDKMYFWPFEKNDYFRFEVFDTSLNPYW